MTTAARPTFDTARGGTQRGEGNLSVLSKQYSSRDLTSHTKLKSRQSGQDPVDEVRNRDFKKDLIERERTAREKGSKSSSSRSSNEPSSSSSSSKRQRLEPVSTSTLDADDPLDEESDDSDAESDDEDDTAELLAELQRIKRDRAEEIMKKEQLKRQEEERIRTENLLAGNPLLNQPTSSDFKVNRRWDDDVVFKNCAKDDDKPKSRGFINDTIRSEFHKRFMDKYVK